MKTPILLLALTLLPAVSFAKPAPGTWGLSFHGDNNALVDPGYPSVYYAIGEKTMLEVVPRFSWGSSRSGQAVQFRGKSNMQGLSVGVVREVAAPGNFRVSVLALPGFAYSYFRSDLGNAVTKNKTLSVFADAGAQLEYFLSPNFSVGGRAYLRYAYDEVVSHTAAGKSTTVNRAASLVGEFPRVSYYFGDTAPAATGSEYSGPSRAWAVGWQGAGFLYGFYSPTIRRVFNDKYSLDLTPTFAYTRSTAQQFSSRNAGTSLAVGVVRKLASRRGVNLSGILEPSFGYSYNGSELHGGIKQTSRTRVWSLGLGAGFEVEYFVLPRLSLGGRAMLLYSNSQNKGETANTGAKTLTVAHNLGIAGQTLNARWYFGGDAESR